MKKLLFSLTLLLTSNVLEAAPYYRFWRGFKKADLTTEQFNKAIQDVFVEATVENGSGNGLVSYIPALPTLVEGYTLPDETALVIYESKEKYDALKATPIGTNYTNSHWDYFTRAPVNPGDPAPENISKSSVPVATLEPLQMLEEGASYDFLNTTPDWQKGIVVIRFLKRNPDGVKEMAAINELQVNYSKHAQGFLLLADSEYLMTYELWKDLEAILSSRINNFLTSNFEKLTPQSIVAKKSGMNLSGMQALSLKQGEAINAQFNPSKKVEHVAKNEIDSYIQEKIEAAYVTLVNSEMMEENETENSVDRIYQVRYKDEQGVAVVHTENLRFTFEKSRLHPEAHYVVINDGETLR